jgi:hypothetical protein
MATKDGFPPDDHFPLFLSEHAGEPEQPGIGIAWDKAVISSRILKTSILVVTATAIGIAILSVGNPVALLANVTASLVDKSALQPGTDQSTPTIQSIAGTQDSPPTAKDAPTRDEIAAAFEPPGQSQTENSEPPSEALFRQFQAWAAEKEAQAQVGPVQPVQDAPAQVVQNAPAQVSENVPAQVAENARAPLRPVQKHRHVRPVHNARAEIRPERNPRAKVRREHNSRAKVRAEQNAQVQVPPVPDARAQDQSVQNAQAPWLLQSFGWRN